MCRARVNSFKYAFQVYTQKDEDELAHQEAVEQQQTCEASQRECDRRRRCPRSGKQQRAAGSDIERNRVRVSDGVDGIEEN
jgi:hypothetical protein